MENKIEQCPVCKIYRINGVFHYSYRNTVTTSEDVAGVICKHILNDFDKCNSCINPKKYDVNGDSFEKRTKNIVDT